MRLPEGEVVFLMTDIVGSSALAESDQNRYLETIDQHDSVVAASVSEFGGHIIKHRGEGDSTFSVFTRAQDALRAAIEIRDKLKDQSTVVRSGIHQGQASLINGDYLGDTVNRCARIRGLASPGQILLSSTAKATIREAPEIDFEYFGLHTLRGMKQGAEIYAAVSVSNTPAKATPKVKRSKLPQQFNRFIGRDPDINDLSELLQNYRLITLHGPGGIGKTRLAIELANHIEDRYLGGVEFIDLTSHDAISFLSALSPISSSQLPQHSLVVLDKVEHLTERLAAWITDVLESNPTVRFLVTSQIELGIAAEFVTRVTPLEHDGTDSAASELLFTRALERGTPASILKPQRATIQKIASRLAGMPLAIELAATNLQTMPATRVLSSIESLLREPGSISTSSAWISVSELGKYTLNALSPGQLEFARGLSCLGSNFSFEAVLALPIAFVSDEVDAAEKIEALVKHSVLSPKWGRAGMSYHLPEVFRTQLSKSATSDTIREVISCFVAWGVATASVILNSTSPDLAVRPYLDELTFAAEHALEVADTESAAWLIRATRKSWIADEVPYPALTLIERMLALVPPGSELEAEFENSRAIFLGMLNRVTEADAAYLRAQEVYSQLGNAVRVLITLHNRGILKFTGGDYDGAESLLKQALEAAHEEGDEHLKRSCLAHLSIVKFTCDSEAEALQFESEFESLNGAEDSDLSNFLIEHKLLHLLIERRLSEAAPLLRKLISEPSHTENHAPLARLAFLHAVYLHQIGEHDLALRGVNQVFSFLEARGIDPKLNNQKLFGLMAKLFTSDELKSTTKPPTREEIQTFLEGFLNHLLT